MGELVVRRWASHPHMILAPNPPIERLLQRPLRILWLAARVER